MGKLMNEDALYTAAERGDERFEKSHGQAQQGQGTMGQLMNDKQLYDNMNQADHRDAQPARRHPQGPEEVPECQNEHLLGTWEGPDMNGWGVAFLGIIAVATAATAVLQVGLILLLVRLVRRFTTLVDDVEHELKPLLANANAVGRDAARVSLLVLAQVERADRLVADMATKVTETVATVHNIMTSSAREGVALLAGLRAALAVFRGLRSAADEKPSDEEDTLFI